MTAGQGADLSGQSDPLLQVRGLRIASRLAREERTIVSGLDLELRRGEALAIVGESGSGKSLTARAIIGLLPPGVHARGQVWYGARNLVDLSERELRRIRGSEIAMIFQDPFTMLNPLMRCGEQITELIRDDRGRRLPSAARRKEAERRLAEVGIDDVAVVDAYPFELSGGMRQRVGIAAALALDPKVVIADEPSTALDVTTQRQILALLKHVQTARGVGLILITHDLRVAFSMCDRISVLYAGSLVEDGAAHAVEQEPFHPYTLGLLLSEPPADRRLRRLPSIAGSVPDADDVAGICTFAPRCRWSRPECEDRPPELAVKAPGHLVACVRRDEIAAEMAALRWEAVGGAEIEASRVRNGTPVVQVADLVKSYGDADSVRRSVTALDGVSLEIAAGESVGLVGESGSGKTTLARCLLGLERPTSGSLTIDGIDASDYSALSAAELRTLRRTIQIIFQDPYSTLNPSRTIGSTLGEALTVNEPRLRDVRARVRALLERVGLPPEYAERKPVALSGGERQRVALARALAPNPRIIVCDEPVSALDVSVQAQILNLLVGLRAEAGIGLLFITHDLAVMRQVVERVYVMHRGEIVETGRAADVLDDPSHPYTRRLVDSVPRSDSSWLSDEEAGTVARLLPTRTTHQGEELGYGLPNTP